MLWTVFLQYQIRFAAPSSLLQTRRSYLTAVAACTFCTRSKKVRNCPRSGPSLTFILDTVRLRDAWRRVYAWLQDPPHRQNKTGRSASWVLPTSITLQDPRLQDRKDPSGHVPTTEVRYCPGESSASLIVSALRGFSCVLHKASSVKARRLTTRRTCQGQSSTCLHYRLLDICGFTCLCILTYISQSESKRPVLRLDLPAIFSATRLKYFNLNGM